MKKIRPIAKKTDFRVSKGWKSYSRLSISTGLAILGSLPIAIWAHIGHPGWLNSLSDSLNKDDSDNVSSENNAEIVKIITEQKESKKPDPQASTPKPTQKKNSVNLSTEVFRQLPDKTLNLNSDGKDTPKPKDSSTASPKLVNLFPTLPKTFVSPYEAKKENINSSGNNVRSVTPSPLTTRNYQRQSSPLESPIRRFNTNQNTVSPAPVNNNTYTPAVNNYTAPNYTQQPYQGQQYQTQPYQAQQPYQTQPYQAQQPYQTQPYQAQQPNNNFQGQTTYPPTQPNNVLR